MLFPNYSKKWTFVFYWLVHINKLYAMLVHEYQTGKSDDVYKYQTPN